jgi:hypothetical protein
MAKLVVSLAGKDNVVRIKKEIEGQNLDEEVGIIGSSPATVTIMGQLNYMLRLQKTFTEKGIVANSLI